MTGWRNLPADATRILLDRVDTSEIDAFLSRLEPDDRELYQNSGPEKERLTLHLAAHYRDEVILRKTGLSTVNPPDEVHAMARGKLAAGGSFGYADLIVHSLAEAGVEMPERGRVLDFGASSGRVARVLDRCWPDAQMHACDPNEGAVAWAQENLPTINYFVNPEEPPLEIGNDFFDLVYAISIWSHYNQGPALAWFDEMHRIIRPGGTLLITFHGLNSIFFYASNKLRSIESMDEAYDHLVEDGFHFMNIFGEEGDWGIVNPDWGEAFLTLDWLLTRIEPRWLLRHYLRGIVEGNQDLLILQAIQ